MKSILIDTSTSNVTISIVDDNKVLYCYDEEIKNDMSSQILPIIDTALSKTNLKLKDLDKIFVVNGPGSFTGIRIGVTIAKVISWALKIDVVPLSSLELMATTSTETKYIVPMIDARRGNVFAGIYDVDLNVIKEDSLVNLNDLVCSLDDNYTLVSYDNILSSKRPKVDILKIISKHSSDTGINPHKLSANYLKLTEAEEKRLKND